MPDAPAGDALAAARQEGERWIEGGRDVGRCYRHADIDALIAAALAAGAALAYHDAYRLASTTYPSEADLRRLVLVFLAEEHACRAYAQVPSSGTEAPHG